MSHAEEIVNNLESLITGREVHCGDVGDLRKFGGSVVLKEGEDGDNTRGGNVNRQFVFPDGDLLNIFR